MALEHHQVNVVVIRLATKAVRQVIPRIDRRPQLAATRTLEAEVSVTLLRDRAVTSRMVVATAMARNGGVVFQGRRTELASDRSASRPIRFAS